jgi:paraquat-inducible protein A
VACPTDPLDRPLALTLAAALVFIVANTAAIVAFCAVIAPGGYILFMLTVLLAVRRPPAPSPSSSSSR